MRKATFALAILVIASSLGAEAPARDPDLDRGKEQVRRGEYDAAVGTLTEVVRRLLAVPNRSSEVADACLHLGIAYAGLGQVSPARAQFVQALKRDPKIAPDPKTTPAAALEAFAEARREAADEGVLAAAQKAKKGSGKAILIGVGAAAVGAGVAVAAAGGSSGASPSLVPPAQPWVPLATSPYIELVGTTPGPGATHSSRQPMSVTIRTANPPEQIRFLYVVEALTVDQRVCVSGQTGPFSVGPGGNVAGTFSLMPRCPVPFTTETLEIALQDPDSGERRFRASYGGRLQIIP
jgi:Tfp pilus assembly protein PilF